MNIYVIEIKTKKTLKTILFSSFSRERYEKKEFTKLYKNYNKDENIAYVSNYKFKDFRIENGVVVEVRKPIEEIIETEKENRIKRLNFELKEVQKALDNPYMLASETKSIEEEIKILIVKHRELSHELYLLEQV